MIARLERQMADAENNGASGISSTNQNETTKVRRAALQLEIKQLEERAAEVKRRVDKLYENAKDNQIKVNSTSWRKPTGC